MTAQLIERRQEPEIQVHIPMIASNKRLTWTLWNERNLEMKATADGDLQKRKQYELMEQVLSESIEEMRGKRLQQNY